MKKYLATSLYFLAYSNYSLGFSDKINFYSVTDISATYVDAGNYDQDDFENTESLHNNASRFGVFGTFPTEENYEVIYRAEYGINLPSDNKDETIFLRELYTGVSSSKGEAKIGFINTPFKLSQNGVDVFSDVIDMKNLISGEHVEDMINITTSAYKGLVLNAAYVLVDHPVNEGERDSGHSISLQYNVSSLYLSLAHDSFGIRDSSFRSVLKYKLNDLTIGFLYQNQELIDSDVSSQDAYLLSLSYDIGKYTLKLRAIDSEMNQGVKSFYGLARDEVQSLSFGVDYKTTKKSKIHFYSRSSRTEADIDVYDVGLGLRLDI